MKNTHGGFRKGAGRPKNNNEPFQVRCNPNVIKKVRQFAKDESNKLKI